MAIFLQTALGSVPIQNSAAHSSHPIKETLLKVSSIGSQLPGLNELTYVNSAFLVQLKDSLVSQDSADLGFEQVVRSLKNVKCLDLSCVAPGIIKAVAPILKELTTLEELKIFHACVRDTSGIKNLPQLKSLVLRNCTQLSTIDQIAENFSITSLDLSYSFSLSSTWGIQRFPYLQSLKLIECYCLLSLPGLANCTHLESLVISFCSFLTSIKSLLGSTSIKHLDLGYCKKLTSLNGIAFLNLTSINLSHCESLTSLQGAGNSFNACTLLDFSFCKKLESLDGMREASSVVEMNFDHCFQLKTLKGLRNCLKLQTLCLQACTALDSIDELEHCKDLVKIDLRSSPNIKNLSVIQRLPNLKELIVDDFRFVTQELSDIKKVNPNVTIIGKGNEKFWPNFKYVMGKFGETFFNFIKKFINLS